MKTIRRFAYAVALTLSTLSFAPSLVSAETARGTFKLTHNVHWQNYVVPAGEYSFSLEASGPSELLRLTKLSAPGTGFVMLVHEATASEPQAISRLLLVSRPAGSFVSAMELPNFGVTLHFSVPAERREMAQVETAAAAPSAR
jgi:hypothetical protein